MKEINPNLDTYSIIQSVHEHMVKIITSSLGDKKVSPLCSQHHSIGPYSEPSCFNPNLDDLFL